MIFGFLFYFFAMRIELLNPGYLAIIGILYNWTKNYVSWEGRSSLAFKPTNSQKFVIVQKKYLNFYLFIYWKISVLWLINDVNQNGCSIRIDCWQLSNFTLIYYTGITWSWRMEDKEINGSSILNQRWVTKAYFKPKSWVTKAYLSLCNIIVTIEIWPVKGKETMKKNKELSSMIFFLTNIYCSLLFYFHLIHFYYIFFC